MKPRKKKKPSTKSKTKGSSERTSGYRTSKKKPLFVHSKEEAIKFHQEHFNRKTYDDWLPRIDAWIPLSEEEHSEYLSEAHVSPWFKFSSEGPQEKWHQLRRFETVSTSDHITCFVGGSPWSAAWCPLPLDFPEETQYVAIATCKNHDAIHPLNHLETENGLIQLWDCGILSETSPNNHRVKFSLGLVHNFGVVWNMEWCPGGTSWQSPDTETALNTLPRLGLLALACGDGIVRILSIPHPSCLRNPSECIYRCEPVVILDPPGIGPSTRNQSTICRCISWQKTDGQKLIAAGFGSGIIAVWNLEATSSLIVVYKSSSQSILRPITSWIAHGAVVNSIKILPYSDQLLLISGSFDRDGKLWNLKDLSTPLMLLARKSVFAAVDWSFKWCGIFASFDEAYANWQASNYVIFKDSTHLNWPVNTLTPHRGCVWDISVSDFVNSEISVDNAGEAVMFTNFYLRPETKHSRRKPFEKLPLYHMALEELEKEQIINNPKSTQINGEAGKSKEKKGKSVSTKPLSVKWTIPPEKPVQRSYSDITKSYGIVFHDVPLGQDAHAIPQSEVERVVYADDMQYHRISDYPLLSLTKVQWNPNLNYYHWVLTAGQAGFMRLSCLHVVKT